MNIFNVNVCHNFPIFHHIHARGDEGERVSRSKFVVFPFIMTILFMFLYILKFFDKSEHQIFSCFLLFSAGFFFAYCSSLYFCCNCMCVTVQTQTGRGRERETTTSRANLLTELPLIVQWAKAGGAWLLVFNFALRLLKHRRVRNFMIALYCSFCC